MAKGNLNPADAYRKAQRKKEVKKNKVDRAKARDFALVKKDTNELEDEIKELESSSNSKDKARLDSLKSDLEKINKKKEEYVKEHPEQRRLVYRPRKDNDGPEKAPVLPEQRNVYKKDGSLRHPQRSIYYDPTMNPSGIPPPGMPYMERPLQDADADSDEDEDDDVALPEGPPPDDEDSDDEIPMPDGPPPGQERETTSTMPLLPPPAVSTAPGLPPPSIPGYEPPYPNTNPQSLQIFSGSLPPPPPPGPPPGFQPLLPNANGGPGSYPPSFPPPPPAPPPGIRSGLYAPPPPSFPNNSFPPNFPPPSNYSPMPPPPPGFFPGRKQSTSSMQDPLSSIPHTTFQALHSKRPTPSGSQTSTVTAAAATVSAAPELRDLKKEATSFVPSSLKKRKPGGSGSKVNAAPTLGPGEEGESSSTESASRPDLLSTIKSQFPSIPSIDDDIPRKRVKVEPAKVDEYAKFREDMSDIL